MNFTILTDTTNTPVADYTFQLQPRVDGDITAKTCKYFAALEATAYMDAPNAPGKLSFDGCKL